MATSPCTLYMYMHCTLYMYFLFPYMYIQSEKDTEVLHH